MENSENCLFSEESKAKRLPSLSCSGRTESIPAVLTSLPTTLEPLCWGPSVLPATLAFPAHGPQAHEHSTVQHSPARHGPVGPGPDIDRAVVGCWHCTRANLGNRLLSAATFHTMLLLLFSHFWWFCLCCFLLGLLLMNSINQG